MSHIAGPKDTPTTWLGEYFVPAGILCIIKKTMNPVYGMWLELSDTVCSSLDYDVVECLCNRSSSMWILPRHVPLEDENFPLWCRRVNFSWYQTDWIVFLHAVVYNLCSFLEGAICCNDKELRIFLFVSLFSSLNRLHINRILNGWRVLDGPQVALWKLRKIREPPRFWVTTPTGSILNSSNSPVPLILCRWLWQSITLKLWTM